MATPTHSPIVPVALSRPTIMNDSRYRDITSEEMDRSNVGRSLLVHDGVTRLENVARARQQR